MCACVIDVGSRHKIVTLQKDAGDARDGADNDDGAADADVVPELPGLSYFLLHITCTPVAQL